MLEYRTALEKSQKELERLSTEMTRMASQNQEYQVSLSSCRFTHSFFEFKYILQQLSMMAEVKLKKFDKDKAKIAMRIMREKDHLKQEKQSVSRVLSFGLAN